MPEDANAASIVRTVIAMAHGLHMDVVAEGVETEAQQRFLAWRRCDQAQGYFYGRPMPLEQLISIYSGNLVHPAVPGTEELPRPSLEPDAIHSQLASTP